MSIVVIMRARKDLPESPTGIGDADGLEPPKRPLKNAAILRRKDAQLKN
jgi:hypothetical protein